MSVAPVITATSQISGFTTEVDVTIINGVTGSFTYQINWGDGTIDSLISTSTSNSFFHTWQDTTVKIILVQVQLQDFSSLTTGFSSTGGTQSFTVPSGVTSLDIQAYGAQGGNTQAAGGRGAYLRGTVGVTPGEILHIEVGSSPGTENFFGGYNGGGNGGTPSSFGTGGGGASDVRRAPYSLTDRLIIAAGGGGASHDTGAGNGEAGGVGGYINGGVGSSVFGGFGGGGATQSSGGICPEPGSDGTLGQGGVGWGVPGNLGRGGGGGGGGLFGGGGGGETGGGGGGSSGIPGGTYTTSTDGFQSGSGQITLNYIGPSGILNSNVVTLTTSWGSFAFQRTDFYPRHTAQTAVNNSTRTAFI